MAPPLTKVADISCSLLLIYRPRSDERLSCPGWLNYRGQFTRINGPPSAIGRAQDRESSPAKDQRSTAVPYNQPMDGSDGWGCQEAKQNIFTSARPSSSSLAVVMHQQLDLIRQKLKVVAKCRKHYQRS